MYIEALQKHETIRIDGLVLEEPRNKVTPFDPRVDISTHDKESIVEFLSKHAFFINMHSMAELIIVDPSYRERLPRLPVFHASLNSDRAYHPHSFYDYEQLASAHIAQPGIIQKKVQMKHTLNVPHMRALLNNSMSTVSAPARAENIVKLARLARMLYKPGSPSLEEFQLSAERRIQGAIDSIIIDELIRFPTPLGKMDALRQIRYASEERFREERDSINLDWESAREQLAHFRTQKNWGSFLHLAARLSEVVAAHIIITPDRFDLILPPLPLEKATPTPLPILRNF